MQIKFIKNLQFGGIWGFCRRLLRYWAFSWFLKDFYLFFRGFDRLGYFGCAHAHCGMLLRRIPQCLWSGYTWLRIRCGHRQRGRRLLPTVASFLSLTQRKSVYLLNRVFVYLGFWRSEFHINMNSGIWISWKWRVDNGQRKKLSTVHFQLSIILPGGLPHKGWEWWLSLFRARHYVEYETRWSTKYRVRSARGVMESLTLVRHFFFVEDLGCAQIIILLFN